VSSAYKVYVYGTYTCTAGVYISLHCSRRQYCKCNKLPFFLNNSGWNPVIYVILEVYICIIRVEKCNTNLIKKTYTTICT
jgi:hypothetical protein